VKLKEQGYDTSILLLAVVLTCLGVVMVYSSSSIMAAKRYSDGFFFLKRQGLFAAVGLLVMFAFMHIDYRKLRPFAVPFLLACIALLVAVLIPGIGTSAGGPPAGFALGASIFSRQRWPSSG